MENELQLIALRLAELRLTLDQAGVCIICILALLCLITALKDK